MNRFVKQLIPYFLLLCISVSVVPFNLFHQHREEEIHCDISDAEHNNDHCHLSIYHAHEIENLCEHKSHINETDYHCALCDFITSHRDTYIGIAESSAASTASSSTLLSSGYSFNRTLFLNLVYNRGPPA